jgi:membrane protein required for colicin V production
MLQKTVETIMLGAVNRIGGIILYAAIYITVFSILLFYAQQMKVFRQETIEASLTWPFIQPWGPKAINALGAVIPFFRDMFNQLEQFFTGVSQKISVL